MRSYLTLLSVIIFLKISAQDTTSKKDVPPLTISGYAEAYYSYDFDRPSDNNRPGFLYSHNRHNEFTANLAFVKASYNLERIRANFALATGTYMNANYAAEPGVLKNIYEANVGYKLSATRNLWLDIGILPSHIGFESAVSKDCWTLSRSMVAENSPYFESGAKITYLTNDSKLMLSALALNGWQRITRVNQNSLMSWGTQILFKPSEKLTLNYSSFLGTDKPDSTRLWRTYHNLYGVIQITDKIGVMVGFDLGTEQVNKGASTNNIWYSPVSIIRFTPNKQWAAALRVEYFSDEDGVLVTTGTTHGFKTSGLSANIDYSPMSNLVLRIEGRNLNSKDKIFVSGKTVGNSNTAITFSAAVNF